MGNEFRLEESSMRFIDKHGEGFMFTENGEIFRLYDNGNKYKLLAHFGNDGITINRPHWEYDQEPDENGDIRAHCSLCGAGYIRSFDMVGKVPYCWRCGVRMI